MLERAIKIAGGQSALARKIGVTQSVIWFWLNQSKRGVPAEFVLKIEQATGISRHEFRPDIWPDLCGTIPKPSTSVSTTARRPARQISMTRRKPKTMTLGEVHQHLRDGLLLDDDDLVILPRTSNIVSIKCYLAMRNEIMAETKQQLFRQ
jgi:DNA-binding transcriptional regulator YdaS (Cro superfamily)